MGARNRVGTGISYRPARLHRMAKSIPWNRFLGSLKVLKYGPLFLYVIGLFFYSTIQTLLFGKSEAIPRSFFCSAWGEQSATGLYYLHHPMKRARRWRSFSCSSRGKQFCLHYSLESGDSTFPFFLHDRRREGNRSFLSTVLFGKSKAMSRSLSCCVIVEQKATGKPNLRTVHYS